MSWAKIKLDQAKRRAKEGGYVEPKISPEKVIELSKKATNCCGCEEALDWSAIRKPHLHHDHKSGEVVGFVHEHCNWAEGLLRKLSLRFNSNSFRKLLMNLLSDMIEDK